MKCPMKGHCHHCHKHSICSFVLLFVRWTWVNVHKLVIKTDIIVSFVNSCTVETFLKTIWAATGHMIPISLIHQMWQGGNALASIISNNLDVPSFSEKNRFPLVQLRRFEIYSTLKNFVAHIYPMKLMFLPYDESRYKKLPFRNRFTILGPGRIQLDCYIFCLYYSYISSEYSCIEFWICCTKPATNLQEAPVQPVHK